MRQHKTCVADCQLYDSHLDLLRGHALPHSKTNADMHSPMDELPSLSTMLW